MSTFTHPEGPPRPRWQDCKIARASRTIFALILREMATTFGRSPGGHLWAVLEPVAAIALLSFAFSLAFHAPPLGSDFALFYATGYLPYMLFHDIAQKTAIATRFSRPLMSFGAVGWLEAIAARFLLNSLTHLVVFGIVISALLLLSGERLLIEWTGVLTALAFAGGLALGTGSLNCFLFLAFPAWERLWTILLRPLFIISGVLFLMEDVPPAYQDLLWYNPLFHITGLMREAVFAEYQPSYLSAEFVAICGLVCFLMGGILLRRHHDDLVVK